MGGSISEKLSTLLDSERGAKLADRVQDLLSFLNKNSLSKMSQNKRGQENGDSDQSAKKMKDESSAAVAVKTNPLSATEVCVSYN